METSEMFYQKILSNPIQATKFDVLETFKWSHSQSCCEDVYVDIEHLDTYKDMIEAIWEIVKIEFWTAPEDWFIVKIYNKEDNNYWIYFPCRNEQNWYYDDEIDLTINIEWDKKEFELQWLWCIKNIIS